jgi:hypothetical protein
MTYLLLGLMVFSNEICQGIDRNADKKTVVSRMNLATLARATINTARFLKRVDLVALRRM